ncbi:MAG: type II 3-dehydroquinate dehydratase [Granulosicoccus sp.]
MSQVLVLNGPNLNLLGTREPEKYGSRTLAEVEEALAAQAKEHAVTIDFFQSNIEGELINRVHTAAANGTRIVVINPAAYTHTSVALRDAFLAVSMPLIEVHVSNIHRREQFRQHSYFSDIALGTIVGFGTAGYTMALDAALSHIKSNR